MDNHKILFMENTRYSLYLFFCNLLSVMEEKILIQEIYITSKSVCPVMLKLFLKRDKPQNI